MIIAAIQGISGGWDSHCEIADAYFVEWRWLFSGCAVVGSVDLSGVVVARSRDMGARHSAARVCAGVRRSWQRPAAAFARGGEAN